ncbi:MAG: SUMF1/EgtB/PvdO family nonheme iron enzyme [Planctomycetes bacterium]|nr:SUMF1/EgtB/PvdO family nonheme iron enzyme [Planctomycetota bacterium]
MFARASIVVGVLFAVLPSSHARGQDAALAELEKQLAVRHAELAVAEATLEEVYLRMERSFLALATDPEATATRIAEPIVEQFAALRDRVLAGGNGKAALKPAQVQALRDGLAAALGETDFEPGYRAAFAEWLVDPILPLLVEQRPNDVQPLVATLVRERFSVSVDFAEVWNRSLFGAVPEARAFANVHRAYVDMGARVERARSPDRFSESGERLPPGMIEVKGGAYEIGPHSGWPKAGLEKRSRRLSVKTFYLDRTEVTNAQYDAFWKALPDERKLAHLPRFWVKQEDGSYTFPEGKGDHPVVGVNFNDARAYAAWAGKRLPTEDEWEVAARGPKGLLYPWGNDYDVGRANDRSAGLNDTAPIGSYPAGNSPFGCADMAGNVDEWTASNADGDTIQDDVASNLVQVVVRGGNYLSNSEVLAPTYRLLAPGLSTRRTQLGFRCAQSPAKAK